MDTTDMIRAAGTSFAICAALGPIVIPLLHRLKFGQSIRDEGPKAHMKKSGTPTMGGLMMMAAVAATLLIWSDFTPLVAIAVVLVFGHMVIGFADDYIKVVMKRNLGLTAKQKLLGQAIIAAAYVFYAENHAANATTGLWIPGTGCVIDIGIFYYFLAFFLLVGTTNAVNLTDGLDGLVSSVSIPVMAAYSYIAYLAGEKDLAFFGLCVLGACLGFLVWNHNPAKVFMGDTGSLALGGAVAAMALLTHTELLLIIIGGVYVMEALSVIIQVTYFKRTGGKRIFRMTPIHHHFELGGWKETKVVAVFTAVSVILSAAGVLLYLAGKGGV